jgi:hypothetical protein
MDATPVQILAQVTQLLDSLNIPYMIGGSFASSVHGMGRHTRDADLVIDLAPSQVDALVRGLERDFYVSREAIQEALRDHDAFNAIHLDTTFKIDFFILGTSPFDREEFRRREAHQPMTSKGPALVFKTPEDTILRKLEWYRAGGEVSEQQWRDVLGVLAVCRARLDDAYLDRWATSLKISDLLARARNEAEPVEP